MCSTTSGRAPGTRSGTLFLAWAKAGPVNAAAKRVAADNMILNMMLFPLSRWVLPIDAPRTIFVQAMDSQRPGHRPVAQDIASPRAAFVLSEFIDSALQDNAR